jgi:hypothetical protein
MVLPGTWTIRRLHRPGTSYPASPEGRRSPCPHWERGGTADAISAQAECRKVDGIAITSTAAGIGSWGSAGVASAAQISAPRHLLTTPHVRRRYPPALNVKILADRPLTTGEMGAEQSRSRNGCPIVGELARAASATPSVCHFSEVYSSSTPCGVTRITALEWEACKSGVRR